MSEGVGCSLRLGQAAAEPALRAGGRQPGPGERGSPGFARSVPARLRAKQLLAETARLKVEAQRLEALISSPTRSAAATSNASIPSARAHDFFRTVACRIGAELARTVAPHCARSKDEGQAHWRRPRVRQRLRGDQPRAWSHARPAVPPHRREVLKALRASLNEQRNTLPGSALRLLLACVQNPAPDVASPRQGCQEVPRSACSSCTEWVVMKRPSGPPRFDRGGG